MPKATLPALSRKSTIGWIGLGAMGHPMAMNLFTKTYQAHQRLTPSPLTAEIPSYLICEADDRRAESFVHQLREKGGTDAASRVERVRDGREMALAASKILTMLPSTPHVEAVYLDPTSGILAGLQAQEALRDVPQSDPRVVVDSAARTSVTDQPMEGGNISSSSAGTGMRTPHTILIDHTTLDPTAAIRIAAQIHQSTSGNAAMLDAPVSGGTTAATAGLLTIMLGSPSPALTEVVRPLLDSMAREGGVVACGGNGAGVGVKVCNNLILAINQIALAEGLALGRALGIDPLLLHSVINTSSGQSWSSKVNSPLAEVAGSPGSRDYEGGFQTRLMLKDVGLALSAANTHDLPVPLTWAAKSVYQAVCESRSGDQAEGDRNAEWATKDFSVVYEWLKKMQIQGVERGWKADPTST